MDPVIDKILHNLRETVASLAEQILSGKLPTWEVYQAQVSLHHAYSSMIADIKDALDDAHTQTDEDARE